MESADAKRIEVIKAYLKQKGADPDLAPVFLKELQQTRVSIWPRLVEIIFAGIGVYCVCRFLLRLLIGA